MNPPMDWARCWRVIKHVREHGIPATLGLRKYLLHEISRMDRWQRQRFYAECSGVLSQGVTACQR